MQLTKRGSLVGRCPKVASSSLSRASQLIRGVRPTLGPVSAHGEAPGSRPTARTTTPRQARQRQATRNAWTSPLTRSAPHGNPHPLVAWRARPSPSARAIGPSRATAAHDASTVVHARPSASASVSASSMSPARPTAATLGGIRGDDGLASCWCVRPQGIITLVQLSHTHQRPHGTQRSRTLAAVRPNKRIWTPPVKRRLQ